jgi:hypothetical protein
MGRDSRAAREKAALAFFLTSAGEYGRRGSARTAEEIMKLKKMFLCIDCDEVFTTEGSPCNPQCPTCASSVFMPLSVWIQTMTAFERGTGEAERVTCDYVAEKQGRIALVYSTPAAA